MSVATPAPVWRPTTPDERRHVAVAGLVRLVLSVPEGHRYASAYGILAGLVTSRVPDIAQDWAPHFAREVERAMSEHPFDRKGSTS